jgi:hypothetical protein
MNATSLSGLFKQDGKNTKNNVFENTFCKKVAEVVKIVKPLVKVLWLVDGEKLTMIYVAPHIHMSDNDIYRGNLQGDDEKIFLEDG